MKEIFTEIVLANPLSILISSVICIGVVVVAYDGLIMFLKKLRERLNG